MNDRSCLLESQPAFTREGVSSHASSVSKAVFVITLTWFLLIFFTALSGGFDASAGERPILILIAVVMPVVVYGLAYLSVMPFRAWVMGLDIRVLILLHSWRMVGLGFVFLFFYGQLPALFALLAGLGDALAAIGALYLGIALYQGVSPVSRKKVYVWNTFGLVDFILAVMSGVMTRTGELLHSNSTVGSEIMGTFPLAVIPGFAVPFYVITHLIVYAQLSKIK